MKTRDARSAGRERTAGKLAVRAGGAPARTALPQHLALLHRTAGNRAVRALIQPRLRVGKAGDAYEREADRVADAILRMPAGGALGGGIARADAPGAQRTCAACEDEQRTPELRRAEASAGDVQVSPAMESQVQRALGSAGQPLPGSTRRFFEPRFGHDFGQVRVHADAQAAQAAHAIDALAFTLGRDIVFGAGQYAPETTEGRKLLAHELTHVVQQAGGTGGDTARRTLVEQHTPAPCLQARWRLDSVTPVHRVDIQYTDGNGSTLPGYTSSDTSGAVLAMANTWQTTGIIHQQEGGQAQLAHWATQRYVFRNDGDGHEMLQLDAIGQLAGNAKSEDDHYARAGAVVWGELTERTASNPTPPEQQLFEIHDGGISTAKQNELGTIEVDIPLGETGSAKITIPLRYVSEGELAPFSEAVQRPRTISDDVSEVDVLLGARVEADADIETAFTGLAPWISRNYNLSRAFARFELRWQNRPAPAPVAPTPEPSPDEHSTQGDVKGDCHAGRNCTGKVLQRRVQHCHNCKRHVSGKSIKRPDGTCDNC